jgi:hypothetical protein
MGREQEHAVSMNAVFVEIAADLLVRLADDPGGVAALFGPVAPRFPVAAGESAQLLNRLHLVADRQPALQKVLADGLHVDAAALRRHDDSTIGALMDRLRGAVTVADERRAVLDLGRAWHGVHYLLAGSADPTGTPAGSAVLGGRELGPDFSGRGPARAFVPLEVLAIADDLQRRRLADEMAARLDADQLADLGIYPGRWEPFDLAWIRVEAGRLARFYGAAAGRSSAVVTAIG